LLAEKALAISCNMPSLPATTSYEAHLAWLQDMNSRYQEMMSSGTLASPSSSATGQLPNAPATWQENSSSDAQPLEASFAGIALDGDDFDEPVYRSFGGPSFDTFASGSSWALSEEDFDNTPVYRGLGGLDDIAAAQAPAPAPMSAEEAERRWLEAGNPPLIRRQHARGATFAP